MDFGNILFNLVFPRQMDSTSASLLRRLNTADSQEAWERFVELYTPLLFHWVRSVGLPPTDAADVVQDVLVLLVDKLPSFRYDGTKNFRGWLRTVTQNKCRDALRRQSKAPGMQPLGEELQVAGEDDIQLFTEREYQQDLARRALELMKNEFEQTTWQACWESITSDRPAAEIARSLGISVNAVYLAKSRVLSRIRAELDGLFD